MLRTFLNENAIPGKRSFNYSMHKTLRRNTEMSHVHAHYSLLFAMTHCTCLPTCDQTMRFGVCPMMSSASPCFKRSWPELFLWKSGLISMPLEAFISTIKIPVRPNSSLTKAGSRRRLCRLCRRETHGPPSPCFSRPNPQFVQEMHSTLADLAA